MIAAAILIASSASPSEDSVRLAVPYIKQPEAMCGGAAATMVFRFWGATNANVRDFADVVDRRAGGISNEALSRAIDDRGWNAVQFNGSIDSIRDRLRDGQPIVILIHERGERFHYVVAVGFTND